VYYCNNCHEVDTQPTIHHEPDVDWMEGVCSQCGRHGCIEPMDNEWAGEVLRKIAGDSQLLPALECYLDDLIGQAEKARVWALAYARAQGDMDDLRHRLEAMINKGRAA
jgi:hypothetical protein